MRNWASLAAIICLAACNAEAGPDGPAAGDPGTYTRMMPDGVLNTTVVQADGTYETSLGKTTTRGKVRTEGDKTCFTAEAEGAQEVCWTNGPIRPGGTFESTNASGDTFTITYSSELPAEKAAGAELAE